MPTAGQSIVCFLDVLGFANMVQQDVSSDVPKHADKLRNVVTGIRWSANEAAFEVHQFSDSIVIAASYSPAAVVQLVALVSESQFMSVERQVLLRGGIALGRHFFDDGFLYSEALVAAYRIEVDRARYPRVIVDENVIALVRGTEQALVPELETLLLRDRDNAVFVDYIDHRDIAAHEEALKQLIAAADLNDVSVFEKYDWLVRYHNFTVTTRGLAAVDFGLADIRRL